jgi:hypothetical protein
MAIIVAAHATGTEPVIRLDGIADFSVRKWALITIIESGRANSYTVREGSQVGDVEVLAVNSRTDCVKIRYRGAERLLTFSAVSNLSLVEIHARAHEQHQRTEAAREKRERALAEVELAHRR